MLEFLTSYLSDPLLWEALGPSLLAKGSSSDSRAETNVSTSANFNPVITLGSAGDPVKPDTASTFAKELLSAPVALNVEVKEPDPMQPAGEEPINTPLLLATLGLLFWKTKGRA